MTTTTPLPSFSYVNFDFVHARRLTQPTIMCRQGYIAENSRRHNNLYCAYTSCRIKQPIDCIVDGLIVNLAL